MLKEKIDKVREMMFDYEAKNRLLGNTFEYSDNEIVSALEKSINEINHFGVPKTKYTVDNFNDENLLILGAIKYLLLGKLMEKARNQVAYRDTKGDYIDREGNIEQYKALYQYIANEFNNKLSVYKEILNAEAAILETLYD